MAMKDGAGKQWSKAWRREDFPVVAPCQFRPGCLETATGLSEIASGILIMKYLIETHLFEEAVNGHLSVYC